MLGCSISKNIPSEKFYLEKNIVMVNGEKASDSILKILNSKPNKKFLGIPLKTMLYNSARNNSGKKFEYWLNEKPKRKKVLTDIFSKKQLDRIKKYKMDFQNWKKRNGSAPVLSDSISRLQNKLNLKSYFSNQGFFNSKVKTNYISKNQRGIDIYKIETNNPYTLDSIFFKTNNLVLDSIYKLSYHNKLLINGKKFETVDFENERNRIYNLFRNSGIYDFQLNSVNFDVKIDSNSKSFDLPVVINVRNKVENIEGVQNEIPYQISKINEVKVFIGKDDSQDFNFIEDYEDLSIYSESKLKYNKDLLRNNISIFKDDVYSDSARNESINKLNSLKNFNYPTIIYTYKNDNSKNLNAEIFLRPKDKHSLFFGLDFTQSDIIQNGVAFSTGLSSINIFRGAEILEVGLRGSIGKSGRIPISEVAWDLKMSSPKLLLPKLNLFKDQYNSVQTLFRVGSAVQENIGLDKQNFSASIEYKWKLANKGVFTYSLFDIEFVKNKNKNNFFGVYTNSYEELNRISFLTNTNQSYYLNNRLIIPSGTALFIGDVLNGDTNISSDDNSFQRIKLIEERRKRLTQNNLIVSSGIQYFKKSSPSMINKNFSQVRFSFSWAGNLLSLLSSSINLKKIDGESVIFDVPFSQYLKLETSYIKHLEINNQILAFRGFFGAAVPYGNSKNIPFNRSFFGGGAYDNRAWEVYRLGPGSSNTGNEFNEANLKLAFNLEYRFDVFGSLKSALFIDAGNIWNLNDNINDSARSFDGFKDLSELAIGTGFGFRYDFGLFLFRLDLGFKTHNPVLPIGKSCLLYTSPSPRDA